MSLPLDPIVETLNRCLSVDVVYLYGSFAQDRGSTESDLDIAVLCKTGTVPTLEAQWELRNALADVAGREVDLLILNDAGPVIAMQVVTKGKVILENNPLAHRKYKMHLFSRYAEFKELTKPMENSILKRKFYG